MFKRFFLAFLLLGLSILAACSSHEKIPVSREDTAPKKGALELKIDRFSPTEITAPMDALTANDHTLLEKLAAAAEKIDAIYWRQVYGKNPEVKSRLEASASSNDKILLHYFNLMYGPFDRLEDNKPFIGTQPKPPGGGFYPEDMAKEEFQKWIQNHPKDKAAFESPYTVIRRNGKGLAAAPYSVEYRQWLEPAAKDLEEAAALTADKSLQKFLRSRAKAFRTNDYYPSDVDWMDVAGSKIDVTLGPYEVYDDNLLNLKAAFEAFLGVRDEESTKALEVYKSHINDLADNLPFEAKATSRRTGKLSPLIVINEVYTGGEARPGVQTAAFTLPNDERVRALKGSKKIMLKNVTQAKFDKTLVPIAIRLITDDQLQNVKFEPFFNHILLHELSHALGPGFIIVHGEKTTVNRALKELYSAIEEAKADVVGLYNVEFLAQKKVFAADRLPEEYVSYLASLFRSVRFGAEDAHGKANMLQFNFLRKEEAIQYDETKQKYRMDIPKLKEATKKLAHRLLTIEAEGNYDGAKALLAEYAQAGPQIQAALRRLNDIPVDIEPSFPLVKK